MFLRSYNPRKRKNVCLFCQMIFQIYILNIHPFFTICSSLILSTLVISQQLFIKNDRTKVHFSKFFPNYWKINKCICFVVNTSGKLIFTPYIWHLWTANTWYRSNLYLYQAESKSGHGRLSTSYFLGSWFMYDLWYCIEQRLSKFSNPLIGGTHIVEMSLVVIYYKWIGSPEGDLLIAQIDLPTLLAATGRGRGRQHPVISRLKTPYPTTTSFPTPPVRLLFWPPQNLSKHIYRIGKKSPTSDTVLVKTRLERWQVGAWTKEV